jgi:hypothetical protein
MPSVSLQASARLEGNAPVIAFGIAAGGNDKSVALQECCAPRMSPPPTRPRAPPAPREDTTAYNAVPDQERSVCSQGCRPCLPTRRRATAYSPHRSLDISPPSPAR